MMTPEKLDAEFRQLHPIDRSAFVGRYLDLVTPGAMVQYVYNNLYDILKLVNNDRYIAVYLRQRGYKVTEPGRW